jgi:hypothetical protein
MEVPLTMVLWRWWWRKQMLHLASHRVRGGGLLLIRKKTKGGWNCGWGNGIDGYHWFHQFGPPPH